MAEFVEELERLSSKDNYKDGVCEIEYLKVDDKACCNNCIRFERIKESSQGYCQEWEVLYDKTNFCDRWENEECDYATDINVDTKHDEVNHPSHYTQLPIECKDVIKYFDACRGQAIKYIWRCEDKGKPITDLRKAIFWLEEKIKMYESEGKNE